MTLNEPARKSDGKLYRPHQYDVAPLQLDFTGTITPAVVDIEYQDDDDDDGFIKYIVAAGDLLSNYYPVVSTKTFL